MLDRLARMQGLAKTRWLHLMLSLGHLFGKILPRGCQLIDRRIEYHSKFLLADLHLWHQKSGDQLLQLVIHDQGFLLMR